MKKSRNYWTANEQKKRRKARKRAIQKEVRRLTNALQKEQATNRRLAKILVKTRLRRGKVPYRFPDVG